jgi:hypothetical protein
MTRTRCRQLRHTSPKTHIKTKMGDPRQQNLQSSALGAKLDYISDIRRCSTPRSRYHRTIVCSPSGSHSHRVWDSSDSFRPTPSAQEVILKQWVHAISWLVVNDSIPILPQSLETSLLFMQQEWAPFKSHQGHRVTSERNKEDISLVREGKKGRR